MKIRLGIWPGKSRKAGGEKIARSSGECPLDEGLIETLAHDINNTIMIVKGYLDLVRLGDDDLPDRVSSGLGIATRAVDNLAGMVSDLVDVAQLESGKLPLHIKNSDINDLASRTVEGVKRLASESGVELIMENAEGPVWCDVDETLILRALVNLLNNSIRFTPSGGRVSVAAAEDAGVKITVRDTGFPVPPQYKEKIFEKSAQIEMKKANARRGNGLSLVFARLAAMAHGGTLLAGSEGPGKGNLFILTIPKKEA